ncbi:THAP-type domain-containing protein [Aphis craccivora]|uniref:THAP-type domain-containing protein n=1 Tax=Aphis craccivora TaxID=307492 RepID=A0A6G0VVS9_APHCR|nr:THAP-type domain-containing protein [Aphis craccivora]
MVFLKLKQDLSLVVLSILFKNITAESCRLIYIILIPPLAQILGCSIYWTSKEEIIGSMPYCFKKFPNTRVVLDCTEIPIQKPKCLACRIKLYSNYKSTFTLKLLIGVSPGGLITYISQPYGGRTSDKSLFEQSGLIQKMSSSDAIMVDKGFLIDDLCTYIKKYTKNSTTIP